MMSKNSSKSIIALIAIIIIFSIPLIGPFFYKPKSFVNRGELIKPHARPLDDLELRNESHELVGIDALKGKWSMLILDHVNCDTVCQQNLYNIRQVRLTQGRRMNRVQLVWILLSGRPSEIEQKIRDEHRLIQVYTIEQAHRPVLNKLFKSEFGEPDDELQHVYFVDPQGNLVMSFQAEQNPKDIQKDLSRLLRVSKTGEKVN